jgi:hypothetical protein
MNQKPLAWTEEELSKDYKALIKKVATAGGRKDQVNLGTQHLIKVMAQGKALHPAGLITQGIISLTNNNAKKIRKNAISGETNNASQSAVEAYTSNDRGKMETHQKAVVDYCVNYFPWYNKAMNENDNCEELRCMDGKDGFPATDIVFAGQHFFDTEKKVSGDYEVSVYKPEWNGKEFIARRVDDYGRIKYSMNTAGKFPDGQVQTRISLDKSEDCSSLASHEGMVIRREHVGPAEYLEIKKLFCSQQADSESYEDFNTRICSAIQALPNVSKFIVSGGRVPAETNFPKQEWETKADMWNLSIEEPLERLIEDFSNNILLSHKESDNDEGYDDSATDKARPAKICRPNNSMNGVFKSISQTVTSFRNGTLDTNIDQPSTNATLPTTLPTNVHQPSPSTDATLPTNRQSTTNVLETYAMLPTIAQDRQSTDAFLPNRPIVPPCATLLPNTSLVPVVYRAKKGRRGAPVIPPQLPILKSREGVARTLDWTNKNMEGCCAVEWKENCRVMSLPNDHSTDRVYADYFKDYEGSLDLFERMGKCAVASTPAMMDYGKDAINSCLRAKKKNYFSKSFCKSSFEITYVEEGGRCGYSAKNLHLKDTQFSEAGRCQLVDEIAIKLGGMKTVHQDKFWWIFRDESVAIEFQCYCCFVCCGNSEFYMKLHFRARNQHNKWNRQKEEFLTSVEGGKKRKHQPQIQQPHITEKGKNFIVAFGNDYSLPYFFIIGTQGTRNDISVQHDFSIAIPDRSYYNHHFANMSRKPSSKYGKGSAIYIRFLQKENRNKDSGVTGNALRLAEV